MLLAVHHTDEIIDAGDLSDKCRQQMAAQSITKAIDPFLFVSKFLPCFLGLRITNSDNTGACMNSYKSRHKRAQKSKSILNGPLM